MNVERSGFTKGPIIAPSRPTTMPWDISSSQEFDLGTMLELSDGRRYAYALAGATIDAGLLAQSALYGGSAATVQHDLTPSAAAIGAETVFITTVTDSTVKDLYKGGYIVVSDGGGSIGQGEMYGCVGNLASGAGALTTFTLDRPLTTAWTSSTRVCLHVNPYSKVIIAAATTPTGFVLGIPNVSLTNAYYGWLQTWGWCNSLNKTALTMGASVITDLGAAGSTGITAGSETEAVVGRSGIVVDTTDSGLIFLQLA